ncbi:MAG: T9SS type A sorting domain-containing protein [Bacteroidota bacterium]
MPRFSNRFMAILLLGCFFIMLNMSFAQGNFWSATNGPYVGAFASITVAPGGVVYTGALALGPAPGANYRSTDDGQTWVKLSLPRPITQMSALPNGSLLAVADKLILSSDQGNTWVNADSGLPANSIIHSLYIADNDHIYVGASDNTNYYGSIYRSNDGGRSWTIVDTGLPVCLFTSITSAGNYLVTAAFGKGVFASTDNGDHWSSIQNDLPDSLISSIAITPAGTLIAASMHGNFSLSLIFRSTDNGAHWVFAESLQTSSTNLASIQVGLLYAETNKGIYQSTDEGMTWTPNKLIDRSISSVAFDSSGSTIFAATMLTGIFRSTDGGASWKQAHPGYFLSTAYSLIADHDQVYAAADWGGVYRAVDRGASWEQVGLALYSPLYLATNNKGDLFSATLGGIFRSIDHAETWTPIYNGLPPPTNSIVQFITFHPNGDVYLGAFVNGSSPAGGLHHSSNNGDNWNLVRFADTTITALNIDPAGRIFVAISVYDTYGRIYRSSDNGASWIRLTTGLPSTLPMVRGFAFTSGGAVIIGIDPLNGDGGIYRSTDYGDHWSAASTGFSPNAYPYFTSIIADPKGAIYAGTGDHGIYRSLDDGLSWHAINAGLQDSTVRCLALDSSGYLYSGGGQSKGIYRSSFTTPVKEKKPFTASSFSLDQNYPNPFNPVSTITFSVKEKSQVTLKIYNILGEVIATLINDRSYTAGVHSATFDGSGIASGVYFYKISAMQNNASFTDVKKMLLLR